MDLAVMIYRRTRSFPNEERFGLRAQIRSATVSVSSNIAEGAGRGGPKEMARFLRVALGSLAELDSQLELAARLGYLESDPTMSSFIEGLAARILALHDNIAGVPR